MDKEISLLENLNQNYCIEKVHGRLKNHEVEKIMNKFLNEEINILVCTSIIESGLDMSNVNTIIINEAQNFGLSQLHQIRGRVGRSNKQAYAGLLLGNQKRITDDAQKRLDAFIKTNSLAGGFDIAGHDLEIRGAGELLGEEQSGQIFEIGFGMYTTMLAKAISQIKNNKEEIGTDYTEIDSYISTLIPQDYIEDIFLRLEMYSDISNAKNESDINHIIMKLEDIYGPVPEHLGNLLDLTRVKIAANYIRAEKIKLNRDNAMILLNDRSEINNNKLVNKFILQEKLKLSDNYHLKYSYSLEDDFSKKCNDLISIIKELSD